MMMKVILQWKMILIDEGYGHSMMDEDLYDESYEDEEYSPENEEIMYEIDMNTPESQSMYDEEFEMTEDD
jgi:hypothetical protein